MATPPEVTSILPAIGSASGGTQVIISGSGLSNTTGVAFGALSTTQYVIDNDALIFVVSPPSSNPGSVPVIVITPSGNSVPSSATQFTYTAAASSSGGGSSGASSGGTSGAGGSGSSQGAGASGSSGGKSGASNSSGAASGSNGASSGGSKSDSSASTGSPASGKSAGSPASGTDTSKSGTSSSPTSSSAGSSASKASDASSGSPAGTPSTSGPTPGNYIPGGLAPVPGGLTGLGGSAGTGVGFGVGTLLPGGGGSAAPSNLPYYVDPAITAQLVQSLLTLVQNATSPDALEAQNIILRRIALQGDVIGSRVPPPRNISEIGGYLNLLHAMKENSMREQTLAGILGVAGPSQPLGWISNAQPLSMVPVTNDRPPVAAQSSFPLTVLVRSDFIGPVQTALKTIHSFGATLPLVSPSVLILPQGGTGTTPPTDVLLYIGRTLTIAPNAALINPAADPIALVRPTGTTANFALASNVLNVPPPSIPPSILAPPALDAVQCTSMSQSIVQINPATFIMLNSILAAAGYYPASPLPIPANSTVKSWARLTNVTGLVTGVTRLGDELSLLYRQDQVNQSVFASMVNWTWNGTTFAA